MREILFRGKRIDTGEWVYGYPVGWQNESGDISIVDSRFGACIDADGNLMMIEAPFVVKVDPSTIGQFTGLTDKNGKKVFEGDIVTQPVRETRKHSPCEIEFHDGKFMAHYKSSKNFFDRYYDINSYTKVIGTIHDKEATP